jgi:hypothetical protein
MRLLPLLITAILCTGCERAIRSAMRERLPHQLSRIVQVETFRQSFDGDENERSQNLNWLIGEDANSALAGTWQEHFFRCLAREGNIEAHGTIVVSFILDPADADRYTIEGWGYFDAVTTKDVPLLKCVNTMPELVARMRLAITGEATKDKAYALAVGDQDAATAAQNAINQVDYVNGQILVDSFVQWVPDVLPHGHYGVPAGALMASGRFKIQSKNATSIASVLNKCDPILDVPVTVSTRRTFAAEYLQWYHEHDITYSIHMKSRNEGGVLSINYGVGHDVKRVSKTAGKAYDVIGHLYFDFDFDAQHSSWKLLDLRDRNMLKRYAPSSGKDLPDERR